jgi:hypothetical protein
MRLGDVAFGRSGDKGDTLNVSVVVAEPADWEWLRATVTVDRVREMYGPVVDGEIERFELPGIPAFNFVMRNTLGGGVSRTLGIDLHGKSWGALLLTMDIGDRPAATAAAGAVDA